MLNFNERGPRRRLPRHSVVLIGKVFTSLLNLNQSTYKHSRQAILSRIPGILSIPPYNTNNSEYANVSVTLSFQKHHEYHGATPTTAGVQTSQVAILRRAPRIPPTADDMRTFQACNHTKSTGDTIIKPQQQTICEHPKLAIVLRVTGLYVYFTGSVC